MDVDDKFTIAGIQGTAAERDQALGQFFRQRRGLRGQVINYVASHGGTEQDGEDVFQDAVVLFDGCAAFLMYTKTCILQQKQT
jgi:hypothetical protein